MEFLASIISSVLSSSVVFFLVKRYFNKKDKKEEESKKEREELIKKIDISLETIRLLSYHRMSEELERVLNKGYATTSERCLIQEMHANYKAHGWNGDMDSRLEKVYKLRTDRPKQDNIKDENK